MYFDKDTGSWVRMPIGWELHHDMVKSLVDQVEVSYKSWDFRTAALHCIVSLPELCLRKVYVVTW